eukprot:CAMPEP_0177480162 /NCGR_PEP_ID=MMETSP0369-20130122/25658_1 /TAXON_ID=447022 ORGANISM="Scrippsiella hangoei-like, Strain SHHI-4" /NCGR_SAMPLE_ID=MMETSP0369 /ASSEMBLY_ACC=CAM_ASM_000364 /LENGTH=83 /DNA_ID=CAMNT_0018955811 /DNA_START=14 /DNA_END=261 /DNA_ORIENTATION=+
MSSRCPTDAGGATHEKDFELPASLRRSRQASFFSFLASANFGFAFDLFSCCFFFFSASVGLSGIFLKPDSLGGMAAKTQLATT